MIYQDDGSLCIPDDAPRTVLIEHDDSKSKLIHTLQCCTGDDWHKDSWDVLCVDTGSGNPIVLTPVPQDLCLTSSEKKRMRRCIDLFAASMAYVLEDALSDRLIVKQYLEYFKGDFIMDYLGIGAKAWYEWE